MLPLSLLLLNSQNKIIQDHRAKMNSQNSSLALVLLLLNLFSLRSAAAPAAAGRTQQCNIINRSTIDCYGPGITDNSLRLLQDTLRTRFAGMYFQQLMISGTDVTEISANAFAAVELENILIIGNDYLRHIDETAFRVMTEQTGTKSLTITNNKELKSSTLYKLADRLAVQERVDLDLNSFEEVPSLAFNEVTATQPPTTVSSSSLTTNSLSDGTSLPDHHPAPPAVKKLHLKHLEMSSNHIRHISSNAFHGMDAITEIALTNNHVEHIARRAFSLASHAEKQLKIKLDTNRLTAASFEEGFIELNDATSLELNLSHNAIEALKETVFKPLLAKNIIIDLTGNPIVCHGADTAWLFKAESSQLLHKLKGVSC